MTSTNKSSHLRQYDIVLAPAFRKRIEKVTSFHQY